MFWGQLELKSYTDSINSKFSTRRIKKNQKKFNPPPQVCPVLFLVWVPAVSDWQPECWLCVVESLAHSGLLQQLLYSPQVTTEPKTVQVQDRRAQPKQGWRDEVVQGDRTVLTPPDLVPTSAAQVGGGLSSPTKQPQVGTVYALPIKATRHTQRWNSQVFAVPSLTLVLELEKTVLCPGKVIWRMPLNQALSSVGFAETTSQEAEQPLQMLLVSDEIPCPEGTGPINQKLQHK